mmetsp:Transcript_23653/g.36502  ORF Transcript_23653/g.36502 Transcript_23653/m.36502 type:complete len:200 (+) Transcript_23653:1130-1729(+)
MIIRTMRVRAVLLLTVVATVRMVFTVLAHKDRSTHELGIIQRQNGLTDIIRTLKLYQTTALAPTLRPQHIRVQHLAARARHVVLQLLPRHIPGEVADVHLFGFGVAIGRCRRCSCSASSSVLRLCRCGLCVSSAGHLLVGHNHFFGYNLLLCRCNRCSFALLCHLSSLSSLSLPSVRLAAPHNPECFGLLRFTTVLVAS